MGIYIIVCFFSVTNPPVQHGGHQANQNGYQSGGDRKGSCGDSSIHRTNYVLFRFGLIFSPVINFAFCSLI